MRARLLVWAFAWAAVAGCADEGTLASSRAALAIEGPWQIPPDVLALGDTQYVAYEGAGPWLGEESCAGSLAPGSRLLGNALQRHFAQVALIGGYNCRPIRGSTLTMSLHGAGRAVDVHIPTLGVDADADNELGDEIGAFLIAHAELLGIQLVIWDELSWGASRAEGQKARDYTGINPHHDHLHVELSVEASQRAEDWFSAALWPEDAGIAADGSVTPWDAAAVDASMGDGGVPAAPGPHPPVRPVIDPPVLEDDPEGVGAEPEPVEPGDAGLRGLVTHAAPVSGSSCAATGGVSGSPWPLLALGMFAALRRRQGRVRKGR